MIDEKEFRRILTRILNENKGVLEALAADDAALRSVQKRDGCPKCGSKTYPCECWKNV